MGMSRSQLNYVSQKNEDPNLIRAILISKDKYPDFGLPRIHVKLRRDGFLVNGKKVYRLLKQLNLTISTKRKRKKLFIFPSRGIPDAIQTDDVWAMDFVQDRLVSGEKFRCFTIVDHHSRQAPGIHASKSVAGFLPVEFLEQLRLHGRSPKHIVVDNGPEFANQIFISWCETNRISVHFIDPGKPVQNAYVESFNGKFRTEFLKREKFKTIGTVRAGLESWIKYYNEDRPHSSLDYLTPKEFADQERRVLAPKINLLVPNLG